MRRGQLLFQAAAKKPNRCGLFVYAIIFASIALPLPARAAGAGFADSGAVAHVNVALALGTPFVRVLLTLIGLAVLYLSVSAIIAYRTKNILRRQREYMEVAKQLMLVSAAITDSKTRYMAGHSQRVAAYSVMVGRRIGMPEHELEALNYSALLHDIGKIGIPDSILNKEAPLTLEELTIVKDHVIIGGDLLDEVKALEGISLGARYHHECIDGTGYAEGLCGDEIPMYAKIIAVCNAFDSMLSNQPYRGAMTLAQARSELIRSAGSQFDEGVTAALISLIEEGEAPL